MLDMNNEQIVNFLNDANNGWTKQPGTLTDSWRMPNDEGSFVIEVNAQSGEFTLSTVDTGNNVMQSTVINSVEDIPNYPEAEVTEEETITDSCDTEQVIEEEEEANA